jgi:TRAP-type C4-dicarboxylate transport system substrate-binding protein
MFRNNKLFYILILILIISSIFNISAKAKYLLKIATDSPDNSIWARSIKDINRAINQKTNGAVQIDLYPGGVMGDQSTVIKKIKLGQLNGSTFSSGGLGLIYKDFAIMGFPMVFQSYKEYDYVLNKMGPYFEKKFDENGYVLLAWTEVGLIYIYSKNKVNSVTTLRNSKPLLLEGDKISSELFKEVNATPVPIQLSDVLTGLQTGLIDTVFSSPYALIVTQWYTKVKYMADSPITLMIGAVMVDKKTFNSMPSSYRNELKSMFKSTFSKINQKIRQDNKSSLELLKKRGQIVLLSVAKKDKQVFVNACTKVANKLTEREYSRNLLNRIRTYVKEAR